MVGLVAEDLAAPRPSLVEIRGWWLGRVSGGRWRRGCVRIRRLFVCGRISLLLWLRFRGRVAVVMLVSVNGRGSVGAWRRREIVVAVFVWRGVVNLRVAVVV